jgi:hypothetical protein
MAFLRTLTSCVRIFACDDGFPGRRATHCIFMDVAHGLYSTVQYRLATAARPRLCPKVHTALYI